MEVKSEIDMQDLLDAYTTVKETEVTEWIEVASVSTFPQDGGLCMKHRGKQIAVFSFNRKSSWFACQNLCPHKLEMVLSRGLLGDEGGIPKIACPMHKKTFSLETGENLNGDLPAIAIYPVKLENDFVFVGFKNEI